MIVLLQAAMAVGVTIYYGCKYYFLIIVPFLVLEGVCRNIFEYKKNNKILTISDFIFFIFKHIGYSILWLFCVIVGIFILLLIINPTFD